MTNQALNTTLFTCDHSENFRILAEDCYISNDCQKTGLNNNDLIIGVSGAGKTRGYVIPNILQTHESLIVADSKKSLYKKCKDWLSDKGYKILCLDLQDPDESTVGYNPLNFIRADPDPESPKAFPYESQEIDAFCAYLCPMECGSDPFWDHLTRLYMSVYVSYCLETLPKGSRSLTDIAYLATLPTEEFKSRIDNLRKMHPDSLAAIRWDLIKNNSKIPKSDSCAKLMCGEKLSAFIGSEHLFTCREQIDFRAMATEKTVLFINTVDTDRSQDSLVNLLYSQALHELCDLADECADGRLPVPIRLIFDDFAAGARIPNFDKIISTIRSREIYVSLIIQSLSQLNAVYGPYEASTIINNCDNLLYLGGQDVDTADYISRKANLPMNRILNLPVGNAYLFTRGYGYREVNKFDPDTLPRTYETKNPIAHTTDNFNIYGPDIPF